MRFNLIGCLILLCFTVQSLSLSAEHIFSANGYGEYTDNDWNQTFYDNCQMPNKDSLTWITKNNNNFLRFSLGNKDVGRCSSDNKKRHSAPYWERAELKQRVGLSKNAVYQIDFEARFIEGFSGKRETFFQIHQGVRGCRVGPLVMLKFNNSELNLQIKTSDTKSMTYRRMDWKINELLGEWHKFRIIFDTISKKLSISINSDPVFNTISKLSECGIPHLKFGIYRDGSMDLKNRTSVVDFDKLVMTKLN